ncbi:hypothetical protein [uncultured Fibrobacter sp.]|jgi:hypothetical protein|uniref:hypothetical protein n=1 Tax=uncultured Fibrobacter sp. TaxID=261512 RepID=UPI0015643F63|nr:hypothetical protein [uncultured Fibrobacter sp.]
MSEEEIKNEQPVEEPATIAQPAEPVSEATPAEIPQEGEFEQPAYTPDMTQPQIIVQKERGFAHYVGFALLCVLCIGFFFMPGIAITYGVSRLVTLNGAAAWIFSAILSVIAWVIFKIKIKGFKKSFYWYIGLCVVVLALLIFIEVVTEANVFANIIALLCGAA